MSLIDIYAGKMVPRTGTDLVDQILSPDAVIGNKVYQMKTTKGYYNSLFYPIGEQLNYKVRIWLRRITDDALPSGKFYIALEFKNYKKKFMKFNVNNDFYHYLNGGVQGYQLTKNWRKFEFMIGNDQAINIPPNAKFMAITLIVNFEDGKATYEASGALIR